MPMKRLVKPQGWSSEPLGKGLTLGPSYILDDGDSSAEGIRDHGREIGHLTKVSLVPTLGHAGDGEPIAEPLRVGACRQQPLGAQACELEHAFGLAREDVVVAFGASDGLVVLTRR